MRRRLAIVVMLVLGLGGASVAAGAPAQADGYWACAGTHHIDFGVCLENPLPERLPQPQAPPPPA